MAIRARWVSGSTAVVSIDHVQLELTYIVLPQRVPVRPVDYRVIAYDRVAGAGSDPDPKNENGEEYRPAEYPQPLGGWSWHEDGESDDFLATMVQLRTKAGIKRLVFGTPAGRIPRDEEPTQIVSAHQWEPMYDDQRTALMTVIPAWLAGDPEREAIVFVGTKVNDPAHLDMVGAEEPDVENTPAHVEKLKRTFFPYRDCVGIRRFVLDASALINRDLAVNLFQWGRDNGMEFVMEPIPEVGDQPDPDIVERWGAFAEAGYVIGDDTEETVPRDANMEWNFTKGRMMVLVISGRYNSGFGTEPEKRRFFQRFAREGYVVMPRDADGNLDLAARIVNREHIARGVSFPVAGPVSAGATNAVVRMFDGLPPSQ